MATDTHLRLLIAATCGILLLQSARLRLSNSCEDFWLTTRARRAATRLLYSCLVAVIFAAGVATLTHFWSTPPLELWAGVVVLFTLVLLWVAQSKPTISLVRQIAGVPMRHRKLVDRLVRADFEIPEAFHKTVTSYLSDCGAGEFAKRGISPVRQVDAEGPQALATAWAQITSLYLLLSSGRHGRRLPQPEIKRLNELKDFYQRMTHRTARLFELLHRRTALAPSPGSSTRNDGRGADSLDAVLFAAEQELLVHYRADARRLAVGLVELLARRCLRIGNGRPARLAFVRDAGFRLHGPPPASFGDLHLVWVFAISAGGFLVLLYNGDRTVVWQLGLAVKIGLVHAMAVLVAILPKGRWAVATRLDERPWRGYVFSTILAFWLWLVMTMVEHLILSRGEGFGGVVARWPWALLPMASALGCSYAADNWFDTPPSELTRKHRLVEALSMGLLLAATAAVVLLILNWPVDAAIIVYNGAIGLAIGTLIPSAWRKRHITKENVARIRRPIEVEPAKLS